jgi:hypothetical protein
MNENASEMFVLLSSIMFNKSPSTGTEIVKLLKMGFSKDITAIRKNNYNVFNKNSYLITRFSSGVAHFKAIFID